MDTSHQTKRYYTFGRQRERCVLVLCPDACNRPRSKLEARNCSWAPVWAAGPCVRAICCLLRHISKELAEK